MQSLNIAQANIEILKTLFPNLVTESQDRDGQLIEVIDFDIFRQEFSELLVDGQQERYQINWPGKKESILLANKPITKTLRPCISESVNFYDSKNLFIEGDNLDALKLLQEAYLNKVKMIYIDPPYNTGSDLIYDDDFSEDIVDYKKRTNQQDDLGNKLVLNQEANGRFHSDWLSMIYPRLKLSRSLLREDGVIFISIDDNEASNLKKICDEIFGESCFVADICVVNNLKGRNDKKYFATSNERLLVYVKSEAFNEYGLDISNELICDYKEEDDKGKFRPIELRKRGGADTRESRPKMFFPIYVSPETGKVSLEKNDTFSMTALPVKSDGVEGCWRWGWDTTKNNLDLLFGRPTGKTGKYNIYEKDYLEQDGELRRIKPKTVMSGTAYSTDVASKQYKSLMGSIEFTSPKSVAFLQDLITYATDPEENIILDFFAGSATTAHAMFLRNTIDSGRRRFILVQIPESVSSESSGYKQGFTTIADVSKERIRKAITSISEEYKNQFTDNIDLGFKVFKIDSSNMVDVYYQPDAISQDLLVDQEVNVKHGRSSEDLLFQVLLEWGVDIALPINKEVIQGKDVYFVDRNALAACFDYDGGIDEAFIKELAKKQPLRVVFRDAGFKSDSVKINVEQLFKLMSPSTDVKCI